MKDDAYVSPSLPDAGTGWTLDNVVWLSVQGDGTGGEVCHVQRHLIL